MLLRSFKAGLGALVGALTALVGAGLALALVPVVAGLVFVLLLAIALGGGA